jgi:hypothetical protein
MEKAKKIYAGSGKKASDTWFKVSLNIDELNKHVQEFNGKKFVKVNINLSVSPDQYGKDVSVSIDTWKPEGKAPVAAPMPDIKYDDDLEF